MKKNILILVMILLIGSLAFAGGGTEESGSGSGIAPDSPTTIHMIGWRFPVTEFYAEELESLNEVENLTVNTQMLDAQSVREQVRLALAGGGESPYEILQGDNGFMTELAANGYIIPIDEYIEKYKDEYNLGDISDSLYKLGSPDGKIYGIPITANSMHYFYNTEIFDEYGLSPPDTYDEAIAIAKQLTDAGADIDMPFIINLHAGWAWRLEFINFLHGFGGALLTDDGQPQFNNQAGVDALELMLRIVDSTMGEEGLSWSIDDVEIGLETGTVASATTWTSRAANMDDPTKSQYVGKIGFAPAPKVAEGKKRAAPAYADYYMIPVNTKVDPEYIFRIIAEVTDQESQERGADYSLMTRDAVASERTDVRYLDAALRSISEGGATVGNHPATPIATATLDNLLPDAVNRRGDLKALLDEIADTYLKEAKAQGKI